MKYRVPVRTNIQLFKDVVVEAASDEEAVNRVQELIEAEAEGVNAQSVWDAIESMRPPFSKNAELQWQPGILECVEEIELDTQNPVKEVEDAVVHVQMSEIPTRRLIVC